MKKVYFASDFHLGRDSLHTSNQRELIICQWLQHVKTDAEKIYLVGDLFDYWYEYQNVVPRGFNHFKSTLFQLRLEGVDIEIFTGNHDLWMANYFEDDLDIIIHRKPIKVSHQNKSLFIGHGDGLGPGDYGYKFIKRIFENKLCQWLFSRLHPNFAIGFMKFCSNLSHQKNKNKDRFKSFKDEWIVQYVESKHLDLDCDYYILGHRHLAIDYILENKKSQYYNIGDWTNHYTYGTLEDGKFTLQQFIDVDIQIYSNR